MYQGYIMRDDLGIYFSLSIIVKKIKKHSKFDWKNKLWEVIFNVEIDKNISKILYDTGTPNKLGLNSRLKENSF